MCVYLLWCGVVYLVVVVVVVSKTAVECKVKLSSSAVFPLPAILGVHIQTTLDH